MRAVVLAVGQLEHNSVPAEQSCQLINAGAPTLFKA